MTIQEFDNVIKLIEDGLSLRKACNQLNFSTSSFYLLIDNDENLLEQYTRAREVRTDVIFEEILEIADNIELGETSTETDKGVYVTTGDMLGHRKLKIDARKWMLGKMNKKYRDGLDVTTDGEKIQSNIVVEIIPPKEDE